jgi:TetR/AcrR family transcriptional repressor of bet genes
MVIIMTAFEKTKLEAAPKAEEKLSRVRQRQKLIEACISALYVHGPSRTTIDKVVAVADMSPGIVNFYFETKAALLVAALEFLAEEFEDRVLAPLAAFRDRPVQGLLQLITLYLDPDIASPRKVSVWYAFWGEASSRSEYYAICGKRDEAFADLVRDLVGRLIEQNRAVHLDTDAVALGLIGALEMIWQEIAFHDEADLDRNAARLRCVAYLRSVFPGDFGSAAGRAANAIASAGAPRTLRQDRSDQASQAYEMLVAAELTLAGIPALRAPDFSPGYQLLAQAPGAPLQRIAVRHYAADDEPLCFDDRSDVAFDWLAIIALPATQQATRRIFIVPHDIVMAETLSSVGSLATQFGNYENNFGLERTVEMRSLGLVAQNLDEPDRA